MIENYTPGFIESFDFPELAIGAAVITVACDDFRECYKELVKVKAELAAYPDFEFDKEKVGKHRVAYGMLHDARRGIDVKRMIKNIVKNDCNVRANDPDYADELKRFAGWMKGKFKLQKKKKLVQEMFDGLVEFFHSEDFNTFTLLDGVAVYDRLIKEVRAGDKTRADKRPSGEARDLSGQLVG